MEKLLFEIGTEEIPAKFMPAILAQLKDLAEKKMTELRIPFEAVKTYGTPRRMTLRREAQTPIVFRIARCQDKLLRLNFGDHGGSLEKVLYSASKTNRKIQRTNPTGWFSTLFGEKYVRPTNPI